MHMIAYVSDYVAQKANADQDILEIVEVSKRNNEEVAIKGVLFFQNNQFLQVIEGVEEDLRTLMARVEQDERHENLEYLVDTPVNSLSFSDWNMDAFQLGNDKAFDRGALKTLSERFTSTLLPRSKTLIAFYEGLLEEQAKAC